MYDQTMKSAASIEGYPRTESPLDRSGSTVFAGLNDLEGVASRFDKALHLLREKVGPVRYHEDRPTPSDDRDRVSVAVLSELAGRVRTSADMFDLLVTELERITNSIDL